MAAKTHLELAAESLVDITHMQRESIDAMAAAQKEGFAKIESVLVALAEQQSQLTAKVDKLSDRIETLSQVTNAQQVIASQQASTVDKLVGLVTTLATKAA